LSKLLDTIKFIMFVRWFYKTSLSFRCKFRTLVLALYLHLSINLLKVPIKSTKFVSGS